MTTIYVKDKDKLPKRRDNDLYPTEPDLIRTALAYVDLEAVHTILDIGAGDGRWGLTAKQMAGGGSILLGCDIVGEKPDGFDDWQCQDYLTFPYHTPLFDLIVSNPPYYLAEKIIRKAWDELNLYGTMVMLLRLSFQAGVDRCRNLWQEIPPVKIGVVSRRPSFYDRGTNGTDYGVFYWEKRSNGTSYGTPGQWQTFLLLHEREPIERTPKMVQEPLFATFYATEGNATYVKKFDLSEEEQK